MLCILYVNAVGFLVGLVALLAEQLLPPTRSRRWIWCVALLASIALPGIYRYHHALAIDASFSLGAHSMDHLGTIESAIVTTSQWTTYLLLGWTLLSAGWVAYLVRVDRERLRGAGASTLDDVPVVITRALGPATIGALRPRILLPQWVLALPALQRQYIVRHEEEHRRSRDAGLLLVAVLPAILLPWSIPLWWQLRRLRLAVEMDCDQRVVSTLGDAHAYGTLLVSVAQARARGPRLRPAFIESKGMLERRLTHLLAPPQRSRGQRALLGAIVVALLTVILTTPHPVLASEQHHAATPTSNVAMPR